MLQNTILEVLTHKSGKFVFSARHDVAVLAPRLIELDVMHRMVATLPVLPSLHAQFKGELVRKSIHGTAAIEGNPLDEEQVAKILEMGDSFVAVNDREREIANLAKAYERFASFPKSDSAFTISEHLIKEIHATITDGLTTQGNIPGQYRNILVEVGDIDHGGKYTPPKILEDIKTLMSAFISWLNSAPILQLHPLIRAALAHYHVGLIHPFRDGNGRTARLLHLWYLLQQGYPSTLFYAYSNNILKTKTKYYNTFTLIQDNYEISELIDLTPFIIYFNEYVYQKIDDITTIYSTIETYTQYLKEGTITEKEKDLWNYVLSAYGENPFSTKQLEKDFGNAAYATIRTFVQKFEALGLLSSQKYSNRIKYRIIN